MGEGKRWRNFFGGGGKVEPAKAPSSEAPSPEAILKEANSRLDWLEAHMAAIDRTPKDGRDVINVNNALAVIFKAAENNTQIVAGLEKIVADFDASGCFDDSGEREDGSSIIDTGMTASEWRGKYVTDQGNLGIAIKIRNWLEEQKGDK